MRERDWCQEPADRIYDLREITVPGKRLDEEPAFAEGIFAYHVLLEPSKFGDAHYCLYFKDEKTEGQGGRIDWSASLDESSRVDI